MKRDMDLVRTILLAVEDHEKDVMQVGEFNRAVRGRSPEVSDRRIADHVDIMAQNGLVQAKIIKTMGGGKNFPSISLTWDGHDFIADARNPDVWAKAKEKAGDVSLAIFKQVLAIVVRQQLGL